MMDIKIETRKPPKVRPRFKERLDQLHIGTGNSFRVELVHWSALRNAAGNANRKTSKKFTVHKQIEPTGERDDEGAYMLDTDGKRLKAEYARVWRIQ